MLLSLASNAGHATSKLTGEIGNRPRTCNQPDRGTFNKLGQTGRTSWGRPVGANWPGNFCGAYVCPDEGKRLASGVIEYTDEGKDGRKAEGIIMSPSPRKNCFEFLHHVHPTSQCSHTEFSAPRAIHCWNYPTSPPPTRSVTTAAMAQAPEDTGESQGSREPVVIPLTQNKSDLTPP